MPRNATTPELDGQDSEPLKAIGPGAGTTIPTIHLSLQGKGGGKSLVASILAQYFLNHGVEIHCLDTDPVNQTFSQYGALGAEHLELMHDGKIDSRGFDALMERLLAEDGIFIVDNGASTFIPFLGGDLSDVRAARLRSRPSFPSPRTPETPSLGVIFADSAGGAIPIGALLAVGGTEATGPILATHTSNKSIAANPITSSSTEILIQCFPKLSRWSANAAWSVVRRRILEGNSSVHDVHPLARAWRAEGRSAEKLG